jgi:hypothetical protein
MTFADARRGRAGSPDFVAQLHRNGLGAQFATRLGAEMAIKWAGSPVGRIPGNETGLVAQTGPNTPGPAMCPFRSC